MDNLSKLLQSKKQELADDLTGRLKTDGDNPGSSDRKNDQNKLKEPAVKRMLTNMTVSSPSNIKGSRFKKFGYHDKESGMTFEAETDMTAFDKKKKHLTNSKSQMNTASKQSQNSLSSKGSKAALDSNSVQYQILTKRQQNRDKLPGDKNLYDTKPPKVDYYDVFYFETKVRDMMNEYLDPWRVSVKRDKEVAQVLRHDYDSIIERLHELECYALIQEWRYKPSAQL